MNFHIRIDARNERHVHFSVFANGAYCGRLTMTVQEFDVFKATLRIGAWYKDQTQVQFTEAEEDA